MNMRRRPLSVVISTIVLVAGFAASRPSAQSDLDAFMKQVIERRDDNWKKLQQYVLDEREAFDVRGPGGLPIWGDKRDYTWFLQEGFFVRSPLRVNGVAVSEPDRRKFEADYLKRIKERDQRAQRREAERAEKSGTAKDTAPPDSAHPSDASRPSDAPADNAPATAPADVSISGVSGPAAADVEALIRQTRQPEFISSAYFLRFKFDQGRYALVGRETVEGHDALRIEYYPQKLFADDEEERERREERRARRGNNSSSDSNRNNNNKDKDNKEHCVGACENDDDPAYSDQLQRLMNKASRVTLWVEPKSHQILKYTFDDLGWDFLPGAWLVRVESVRASMTMGEPFPDVWLPKGLEMNAAMGLAIGTVIVRYTLDYHDYRRAEVTSRIGIPGVR